MGVEDKSHVVVLVKEIQGRRCQAVTCRELVGLVACAGLVVSVDTAQSLVPRGRVVETFPPADTIVALPAGIRMVVSTGPPLVPMPLVLGLAQPEAVQLLDSLGLVVSDVQEVFRFGRDQGIVVEQEPAADIELERGSEVQLSVGRRGRPTEH